MAHLRRPMFLLRPLASMWMRSLKMAARNLLNKCLSLGLLIGLMLSLSCAHTTRMISVPAGAEIFVDGKKVGTAPMNFHQNSGTLGRSYQITAKMPDGRENKLKEGVKICP